MFLFKTKKILTAVCLIIFVLSFAACAGSEDKVVASLGKYEHREFYTSGGFQDYTDYAKYYYTSGRIKENVYMKQIQEINLETINKHLDDFEEWIEAIKNSEPWSEVVVNYDFDRGIIDSEDYFYIVSEKHRWSDGSTSLVNYNIYLFDAQTQVLYYFHNNI